MTAERALAHVALDDKYAAEAGRVYMNGTQALVKLPMLQRRRDEAAGLNTACFISGYRGSPLGALDQRLWEAKPFLDRNHIRFQPGVNEELGATAVWGSQQTNLFPGARYDGVFAMWYGKGPGVDGAGDVFKHANFAGTSKHGGVLVLAGDDHNCKSSTVPHQSEHAFVHAMIPVLNPANVQEILDYGLIGWTMSRFSGCWIAMKTIADTVDSSASVTIAPERLQLATPDFAMPDGGLHIRWPDPPLAQEHRLMKFKLYAALAFARANRLDRVVLESPRPRLGVVTTGKSYLDVRQALDELGLSDARAADLGLTIYKVGMPWPLERDGARHFAEGLEEIVVVEEKRAIIENQLKEQLYNWRAEVRPRVVGKFDENLDWILPSAGELTPAQIAVVIGRRLLRLTDAPDIAERVDYLDRKERIKAVKGRAERRPTFCSGCPHNTSTIVPEGSRALAGIGCHYMATWLDRRTDTFSQMGGEGVAWVGQAPFTNEAHVFANLGDGTYYHSGLLAIRQAIAAKVNITYKLLFNDAVAMTGGQPVDGVLTVPALIAQLQAEGVGRVVVVTDEPDKYPLGALPRGVPIHHRDELDTVQREMRQWGGVSVLVYDQTCATEKRRRRKRGKLADPAVRAVVNELVCEGCGDCSKQSSCVSVVPSDTEWGRKRQIDQSSCNKDLSCLKGFCPSFVTVEGGRLKKPKTAAGDSPDLNALPAPLLPDLDARPWSVYVTGVGGAGVITIGAVLGMAAHLEGLGVGVLDMAGLAQKGGAVASHLRFAKSPDDIHAVRIAAGGADAVLAGDAVTAAAGDALSKMATGRTRAVVNTHEIITIDFLKQPDFCSPMADMLTDIAQACGGPGQMDALDATGLATDLLGDAIAANPLLLGFAWQKGLIPLSDAAILEAMRLNGTAVAMNVAAFRWGRLAAVDMAAVRQAAAAAQAPAIPRRDAYHDRLTLSETLEETIRRRAEHLAAYQNQAYAEGYRARLASIATVEQRVAPGSTQLTDAAARGLFQLMAVKDEFETARLFVDSGFLDELADKFEGDWKPVFHFAPPALGETGDGPGGRPAKRRFSGWWILPLLRILAKARVLRGSWADPFRHTGERKAAAAALADYEATLDELAANLRADNLDLAAAVARTALAIRGFGPVRAENQTHAAAERAALMARFRAPPDHAQPLAAE